MVRNRLHSCLMTSILAGGLLCAPVVKADNTAQIAMLAVDGVSALTNLAMTICSGNVWMMGTNVDPAQLIPEALVTYWTIELDVDWEEKPKKTYEYSAYANSTGENEANIEAADLSTPIQFQTEVLHSVGIEAAGLGPDASTYADSGVRETLTTSMTYLNTDGTFNYDLTKTEEDARQENQKKNLQWAGTAAVTRAELGMAMAAQSAVNEGTSIDENGGGTPAADIVNGSDGTPGAITLERAAAGMSQQNLQTLPGSALTTVHAMRIMAVVNLENAQRVNMGDMLQGEILAVEAARALATTVSPSTQED